MNVNLKAATRTMELLSPMRLMPMANLTGEGVKSFVNAEKTLIESMVKPRNGAKTTPPGKKRHPAGRAARKTTRVKAATA